MWKAEKEAFKGFTPWNEKDMEQITKLFLYLCDVKTVSDWRSIVCYQLIRLITWALQLRLGSVTCYQQSNWIVACRYSNRKHLDQIGDKSLRCLCVCGYQLLCTLWYLLVADSCHAVNFTMHTPQNFNYTYRTGVWVCVCAATLYHNMQCLHVCVCLYVTNWQQRITQLLPFVARRLGPSLYGKSWIIYEIMTAGWMNLRTSEVRNQSYSTLPVSLLQGM